MNYSARTKIATAIAVKAGASAMSYFNDLGALEIDAKGHQDFVSQADTNVELMIRAEFEQLLPDDAIVGEEHAPKTGTSGVTWVIDPIDGTANFIAGIPFWCIVIAGVVNGQTEIAVIHDPNHNETYVAVRGQGATLNDKPMAVRPNANWDVGTLAVGSSRRSPPDRVAWLLQTMIETGAVFQRVGSGALGLAYVACGRFLGYTESYMNAWDCLAGQLLIAEAGGMIEEQNADEMIANGGRVVAAAPGVYPQLLSLTNEAFGLKSPPKPIA